MIVYRVSPGSYFCWYWGKVGFHWLVLSGISFHLDSEAAHSCFSLFIHYYGMHLDLCFKFGKGPVTNGDDVSIRPNRWIFSVKCKVLCKWPVIAVIVWLLFETTAKERVIWAWISLRTTGFVDQTRFRSILHFSEKHALSWSHVYWLSLCDCYFGFEFRLSPLCPSAIHIHLAHNRSRCTPGSLRGWRWPKLGQVTSTTSIILFTYCLTFT